ncbi:MAG: Gfo/Idh/MocA family oxidoreductase [Planctomycetes bacterium]|nr:Gfo/Idh/MocA family oxidoreductase [Planctomycetota bacterium]
MSLRPDPTRRTFLKASGAALLTTTVLDRVAQAAAQRIAPGAFVRADETLKIALIGCGGRGTGAAAQALSTAGPVKLVALADAFRDRLEGSLNALKADHADRVDVTPDRCHVGFEGYKAAIDACDVAILTTPPGFRPSHFEYAVAKGKHVFMEKPVATDAPGVRRVLAAAALAKQKNLKVGVGLQRHHDPGYVEAVRRVQDGAIGDVMYQRVYWCDGGVWVNPRQPGQTEMEYQMRNWYYFNWLCGDHIVEQHIHNLDVANWVKNGTPIRARGHGGRQVRTGIDHGEIFDHHQVEFDYADGSKLFSYCHHWPNAWSSVSEHAHGTKGYADLSGKRIEGAAAWQFQRARGDAPIDPYQIEHDVLFDAIRNDKPHNEAVNGAHATMTAIFGRMATYSGKELTWDEALASEQSLFPAELDWKANPKSLPDANGRYKIALPGAAMNS